MLPVKLKMCPAKVGSERVLNRMDGGRRKREKRKRQNQPNDTFIYMNEACLSHLRQSFVLSVHSSATINK